MTDRVLGSEAHGSGAQNWWNCRRRFSVRNYAEYRLAIMMFSMKQRGVFTIGDVAKKLYSYDSQMNAFADASLPLERIFTRQRSLCAKNRENREIPIRSVRAFDTTSEKFTER